MTDTRTTPSACSQARGPHPHPLDPRPCAINPLRHRCIVVGPGHRLQPPSPKPWARMLLGGDAFRILVGTIQEGRRGACRGHARGRCAATQKPCGEEASRGEEALSGKEAPSGRPLVRPERHRAGVLWYQRTPLVGVLWYGRMYGQDARAVGMRMGQACEGERETRPSRPRRHERRGRGRAGR